jgi:hypothetical protein
MALHKATLKHIRRNCLSGIPLTSYYTPINKDRDGLTRWRCHRGTSANEGLHQKLRRLVRGPGFPFLDLIKRMPKRKRGEGND